MENLLLLAELLVVVDLIVETTPQHFSGFQFAGHVGTPCQRLCMAITAHVVTINADQIERGEFSFSFDSSLTSEQCPWSLDGLDVLFQPSQSFTREGAYLYTKPTEIGKQLL